MTQHVISDFTGSAVKVFLRKAGLCLRMIYLTNLSVYLKSAKVNLSKKTNHSLVCLFHPLVNQTDLNLSQICL